MDADVRPLVLVVDDQPKALKNRVRGLEDAGCQAIPVRSRSSALSSLRDGPAVDLIVTDIHLGNRDPRGGISLAVGVKAHYDFDLPIVAYSGKVTDDDLEGSVPDGVFALAGQRGNLLFEEMEEFNQECRELALVHRQSRVERALSRTRLSALPQSKLAPVQSKAFDLMSIDDLEAAIVGQGYSLRIISSDAFADLAATVPVWVRQTPDRVEVQVCGQPYLHWEDKDEQRALAGLVRTMSAYSKHLASPSSAGAGTSGGMSRLKSFLDVVIDEPQSTEE